MTEIIADTNIFLRLILEDNPKQADEAERLFKKAKKKEIKLYIPQIVIFEIEFALSKYYKFPKNQVIDKLDAIVAVPYFSVQDGTIFRMALKIYQEKSISLVDCFLIASCQINRSKLFTFDQNLAKLA